MTTPTTPTTPNLTKQKSDVIAEFQALVDGINSQLTGIDPFLLNGTSISRKSLLAQLNAWIAAANKTKADRKLVSQDVAAEQLALATAHSLRKALRAFCVARFGATNPIIQELGFVQNRTPKTTPATKAAGATKAVATRKANGTKGKQQRAANQAAEVVPSSAPAPVPASTAVRSPTGTNGSATPTS